MVCMVWFNFDCKPKNGGNLRSNELQHFFAINSIKKKLDLNFCKLLKK
jgi:hypothetical protein